MNRRQLHRAHGHKNSNEAGKHFRRLTANRGLTTVILLILILLVVLS